MSSRKDKDDALRCSFCGKHQQEVKKLIAGPAVYICNECVDICNEIIVDDQHVNERTEQVDESSGTHAATAQSIEYVSCPACSTPLVLKLGVMSATEVEFHPKNQLNAERDEA